MMSATALCRLYSLACRQIGYNLVDQPVFKRLFGRHEFIAVGVFFDLLERATGVVEEDAVEAVLGLFIFGSVDQDVLSRAFHTGRWLMDHDPAVRQRVPFAFGTSSEQNSTHRGTLADAVSCDIARDELHCVVDREAGGY